MTPRLSAARAQIGITNRTASRMRGLHGHPVTTSEYLAVTLILVLFCIASWV